MYTALSCLLSLCKIYTHYNTHMHTYIHISIYVFLPLYPSGCLGNLDLPINIFIIYYYGTNHLKSQWLKTTSILFPLTVLWVDWAQLGSSLAPREVSWGCTHQGAPWGVCCPRWLSHAAAPVRGLRVTCGWAPRSSVPGVSIPEVPGRNCKTRHDSALKSGSSDCIGQASH